MAPFFCSRDHLPAAQRSPAAELAKLAGCNESDLGCHNEPWNFDSAPEKDLFRLMLDAINLQPDQVENFLLTGNTPSELAGLLGDILWCDREGDWSELKVPAVVVLAPAQD